MQKGRFSEYTYANAVNYELMFRFDVAIQANRLQRISSVTVADVPSLPAEALVGYDVLFPYPEAAPVCYQYKLSESLSNKQRLNTVNNKLATIGGALDHPSFEFEIRRRQNDTLRRLTTQILVKAFYCVPKFDTSAELNIHTSNKHLLRNSLFLSPPALTGRRSKHMVYFDLSNRRFICSEPQELNGVYEYPALAEYLYQDRRSVNDLLESILSRLRKALSTEHQLWERIDTSWIEDRDVDALRPYRRAIWLFLWIRYLITLFYGAEFHLV